FGSGISWILLIAGLVMSTPGSNLGSYLIMAGIALFSTVVFFQLVNLPVEFDASRRAKAGLVERGIVPAGEMTYVNKVLSAAALTDVAATLQSVLTLLYLIWRFMPRDR